MYNVFRGGCGSTHPSTFVMSRPEGFPSFILLIIRSQGSFQIQNEHYRVLPGSALILSPGTPYSYCNPNGEYMDDWLHFSVENTQDFSEFFPYLNRPFFIGGTENYTTLIRQILWDLLYSPQPYSSQNMDALFRILLNRLLMHHQGMDHSPAIIPYKSQLQTLRLELQNDFLNVPSISQCASTIGISESYFQHLYTESFGISFQKDVIAFRITYAKNLLLTTDLAVEQIAELCGYNNPVHFYRQFKKIAGITPAKFRKSSMNLEVH